MATQNQYDVIILGSGISGSILGTILAKEGAQVLLLDGATHPRFVVGESTVRHTMRTLKIMAERFDIEELRKVSSGDNIHRYVSSACGEKRNFGFLYHREGKLHNPAECTQLVIPPFREGYEAHLFRQDIDAYLYQAAIHYGADGIQNVLVEDVDIRPDGVTVRTNKGQTFTSNFFVDAAGFRSPLARKLNLRHEPTIAKTHSRAIFTHMIDVGDFDEIWNNAHGQPEKWYSGTCHHIFDGGWLWVIPFNNRKGSTNPLVSIGLHLDSRRYPRPLDITPQEEWERFLDRYPSIAVQFKQAKTIRPWVTTDRIQYSSKQVVGDRWCLMAHSAGFVDAIFSRGLANATETLAAFAPRLVQAVKDNDYSMERFEYVEQLEQNLFKNADLVGYGAYVAYRDFDLWNAWFRIWALGVGLGDLRLASIYQRYKETHDNSILPDAEEPLGLFASNHVGFAKLFEQAVAYMEAVDAGNMPPKEAANKIFQLVKNAPFSSPAIGLADPNHRFINAGTPAALAKSAWWALTSAPPEMKQMILTVSPVMRSMAKI